MRTFRDLLHDTEAVTSIEYAAIAALIAVGGLTTVTTVGDRLGYVIETVGNGLTGPPPANAGNG